MFAFVVNLVNMPETLANISATLVNIVGLPNSVDCHMLTGLLVNKMVKLANILVTMENSWAKLENNERMHYNLDFQQHMMALRVYNAEMMENRMVKLVNMMGWLVSMMAMLENMMAMLENSSVKLVCILVNLHMVVVCHRYMMGSLMYDWILSKKLVNLANKQDLPVNNVVMPDLGLLVNMLDYQNIRDL